MPALWECHFPGIKGKAQIAAESCLEWFSNAVAAPKLEHESWQNIFTIRDELALEVSYTGVSADDFEGLFWKCLICSCIVTNIGCNRHLCGYMLSAL